MRISMHHFAAAAALLLFAAPCLAANVVVTAQGMTFTPATVTIHAGDSVTFKNNGGFHNVAADDGSFRCAEGCDRGDPSNANWQFTLQFNDVGTIGYHCEVHGAPGSGMHGTIIVEAAAENPPPITLGGYLSGAWYDPDQAGQGFDLEFTNTANILVAFWYTYAPDGSGPYWIYAQGPYDATQSSVTLPAILSTGAAFGPNFVEDDVTQTPWGTLTFDFTGCNKATVSWDSSLPDYGSGSMPLIRLTQIAGTECPPPPASQ